MTTLKCSYCGYGIHYHDEPDGTQYFFIPLKPGKISERTIFR